MAEFIRKDSIIGKMLNKSKEPEHQCELAVIGRFEKMECKICKKVFWKEVKKQ